MPLVAFFSVSQRYQHSTFGSKEVVLDHAGCHTGSLSGGRNDASTTNYPVYGQLQIDKLVPAACGFLNLSVDFYPFIKSLVLGISGGRFTLTGKLCQMAMSCGLKAAIGACNLSPYVSVPMASSAPMSRIAGCHRIYPA